MERPKIIYVEDTEKFRTDVIDLPKDAKPDHPGIVEVRANYSRLRQAVPELEERAGLITHSPRIKELWLKNADDIRKHDKPLNTTRYFPLDLLAEAVKRRREYDKGMWLPLVAYRNIFFLVSKSGILNDNTLDINLQSSLETFCSPGKIAEIIRSGSQDALAELIPTEGELRHVYDHVLAQFEANKVSKEFPLNFIPVGYLQSRGIRPEIYEVVAGESPQITETVSEVKETFEKLGIPTPKFPGEIIGDTEVWSDLESLLDVLPENKIIITDLYIADAFPELAETGFEAVEFRL